MQNQDFQDAARTLRTRADFWSLRVVEERTQTHEVRNDIAQPRRTDQDLGAMLTAWVGAGAGYAATSDLSAAGLQRALDNATTRARASAEISLIDHRSIKRPDKSGSYTSPNADHTLPSPKEWIERLALECAAARIDSRIVERIAKVSIIEAEQIYITSPLRH
ncbi:TldD family protein, Beta/Gamma-proteobacterial subgroup [Caballeronia sordidicola]|uniref:TldD family protein, Beta/Gamma-proteobacterial subgroup n=1 Tax=Caballeronia sordidicola TaxID=196367 RepID=A0A242MYG7_CABSO|nr:TldD family protein, Beta/Gamma-proteobacterial subgroup [Caballeronia sordidicola]